MKKFIGSLMAILACYCSYGQNKIGQFYLTWGYHRDSYTRSTIKFKDNRTDDYNFTFYRAKAKDKPDLDDFFHTPLTVPQYILNVGYFFANKPKWGIEFSWDHLKYVVIDNQHMHVKGEVHGQYFDVKDSLVTRDFVHFEHTNGNNYASINVVRKFALLNEAVDKGNKLNLLVKAGIGGLVPKTDSRIMGNHNDGPFRLSGWVVGASADVRYNILKYFYLEGGIKGAFADYTSAKVYRLGRAQHHFFSVQYIWAAGVNFPLQHS